MTETIQKARFDRLPAWAKDEIGKLRRENERLSDANKQLQAQLAEYEERQGGPVTLILEPYRGVSWRGEAAARSQAFPMQSVVRVHNAENPRYYIDISAKEDGSVDVSSGVGSLRLKPVAGNVVNCLSEKF